MNPDQESLTKLLRHLAGRKNTRIGIGVKDPTAEMIEGVRAAREFCSPVLYGVEHPEFESFPSPDPERRLIADLEKGRIEGAVRGQINSFLFREQLLRLYGPSFQPTEQLITVFEFPDGRAMVISPASNVPHLESGGRAELIEASIKFCRRLNLSIRIALLTVLRADEIELLPRSGRQDDFANQAAAHFRETDLLVEKFSGRCAIKNFGIDFEQAWADQATVLIEPDGTSGNQVIRTIHFLKAAKFFGAPVMNAAHVVVESFKNSRELSEALLLAAALANAGRQRDGRSD